MIKAIFTNGLIQPIDPIPEHWSEGQELLIEAGAAVNDPEALAQWLKELDQSAAEIPPEDHERFRAAVEQHQQEQKELMRRRWGQS